jgi:hypothetical protein
MNTPFIAYKGFDKDLKCRGFQYSTDQTFTLDSPPQVCGQGLHFCFDLEKVFSYYPDDGNNRFFEVEILGEYKRSDDKGSTNSLRLIREIDVKKHQLEAAINKFLELSAHCGDLILGGSLSLMVQGHIPLRKSSDLDVVCHRYFEFPGAVIKGESFSQDNDAIKVFFNGENFDFFIIPQVVYKTVDFNGKSIKVQSSAQIIEAKLKYFNKGITKHKQDIIDFLSPKPVEDIDSSLPF